ncbi:hypothetical protein BD626DRAFT_403978 [Schizophyllum amplum]|uniref:Uncharacterized protein n=1 Tax=Schizophyllum amplum TaxID=97359 RepID=A0A550CCU8_9AGAR|nr:hypothetical protein BD626DRAFT_403978 [Auriculariopsis ampla]
MSDYTATRNALLKAEEQLAEFRRLFGDDLDEKRQAQYNKLEQRAIQLRREYKSSSARIGGARLGTAFSPQAGAKYEELCGYISELQVSTKDMHRTLESFQAHWKKTASETDQDDMDVDPSGRPRKRARLDERAQAAQDEKARRLEDLSDRVAQSETRLADLRTLLQGRVDDLIGRVDVTLGEQTSKIVEVFDGQLRVSADGLPEDASPSDETLTLGQRHALLIRELDGMDEDIQSIGNYVAQVKEHIDEQSKEIAALENEVLESSRQAASVREKLEAYEAQQAANKERLANLSERFEQHMARHNIPSPQRTPSPQPELITTHDAAMAALQDSIAQAVRRMLIPVVQGARQDIQSVIETQKNAVLAEVWPQMQQLLGAVHAIDQRLPQGN